MTFLGGDSRPPGCDPFSRPYRRFIKPAGTVAIGEDRLTVTLDRRCHDPIVREAALDRDP
jgi:hypothetical protein